MNQSDCWELNEGKQVTYTLPFKADKKIYINASASITAPSIEVNGKVEAAGGEINCAGLLSATDMVESTGSITAGSLQCGEMLVTDVLIVKTSLTCTGTVEVNEGGTLILPAGFDIKSLHLDSDAKGTIYVGTKAYNADGTPLEGASIPLTDGYDLSDTGFTWDSATCTLTLTSFTRTYNSDNVKGDGAGITIIAQGKDVTLVLNGTNTLTGLAAGVGQTGILCSAKSLTLKGGGSLKCEGSSGALVVHQGVIQLEDCDLLDGKKIYTVYDDEGSPLGSYVADSYDAPVTSFSLRQNSYAVTLHPNDGTIAPART